MNRQPTLSQQLAVWLALAFFVFGGAALPSNLFNRALSSSDEERTISPSPAHVGVLVAAHTFSAKPSVTSPTWRGVDTPFTSQIQRDVLHRSFAFAFRVSLDRGLERPAKPRLVGVIEIRV